MSVLTGKDIIKLIIEENGLDVEYKFDKNVKKQNAETKKKTYASLEEMIKAKVIRFQIDSACEEVRMYVDDPLSARRFGLSDSYRMYIWDGKTMYFFNDIEKPHTWSISYGGGSTTMVDTSVVKYRNTAAMEMIKATALSKKKIPSWMEWRVRRYNTGGDVLNIFGQESK